MGGTSFHTSGSTCCSTGTTLTFHISRTWKGFTCHRWPFRAHVINSINSINHSNSRENTPCLVYHVSQNSQSHAMGGTFIGERRLSLGHDRRHATHTPNSVGFLPTNPKQHKYTNSQRKTITFTAAPTRWLSTTNETHISDMNCLWYTAPKGSSCRRSGESSEASSPTCTRSQTHKATQLAKC